MRRPVAVGAAPGRVALVVLTVAVSALGGGCRSVLDIYSPSDLEGPPLDFSGAWVSGGATVLRLEQSGTGVTGVDVDFEGRTVGRLEGEATGRVIRGAYDPTERMTLRISGLSQDRTATARWDFVIRLEEVGGPGVAATRPVSGLADSSLAPIARFAVVPSADDRRLAPDPALRGGLTCILPFRADGRFARGPSSGETTLLGAQYGERIGSVYEVRSGARFAGLPQYALVRAFVALVHCPSRAGDRWVQAPHAAIISLGDVRSATRIPLVDVAGRPAPLYGLLDPAALRRARPASPHVIRHAIALDGKPAFVVVAPSWDVHARQVTPATLDAEIYVEDPESGAYPVAVVGVASRNPRGEWLPTPAEAKVDGRKVRVELVVDAGGPVRVDIQPAGAERR